MTINFHIDPFEARVQIDQHGYLPPRPLGGHSKRAVDLSVALVALVLALPIMLIVALLIRATAGAPVLFAQTRIGFNGTPFTCYKFRTMTANAQEVLLECLSHDPQAAKEWEETRKLRQDPRVTFLGSVLRRSSLDELPQLYNVLRGDMSCVGPRPIVADELPRYHACASDYLRARPGLTGLWQVSGRNTIDYPGRVSLDRYYVQNWSLWADFDILWRTIFAVLKFDRAS